MPLAVQRSQPSLSPLHFNCNGQALGPTQKGRIIFGYVPFSHDSGHKLDVGLIWLTQDHMLV